MKCDKALSCNRDHELHMMVHTEGITYQCRSCDKTCLQYGNFKAYNYNDI